MFGSLPLPVTENWNLVIVDVGAILEKFCHQQRVTNRLKYIKKVQVCSSLLLRDVVTSDSYYTLGSAGRGMPKELNIRNPSCIDVIDMINFCTRTSFDGTSVKAGENAHLTRLLAGTSLATRSLLSCSLPSLFFSCCFKLKSLLLLLTV